jgi:hypothetical protein
MLNRELEKNVIKLKKNIDLLAPPGSDASKPGLL